MVVRAKEAQVIGPVVLRVSVYVIDMQWETPGIRITFAPATYTALKPASFH
jgi:hypothetical protein